MKIRLVSVCVVLLLAGIMAVSVMAQDTPSISVSDQISSGSVVIDRVYSDGPGFVVVRGAGGRGTPGPVLGHTAVASGLTEDVVVELNLDLATGQLFAALHTDDTNEGDWDFGLTAGADAPVKVDDQFVHQLFTAYVIEMSNQPVAEDNTVVADTVVMNAPGWLVIHADNNGAPGPVLGYAPVRAGRNANVVVELAAEGRTDVVWPMLHVDTGTVGEYEFGTVEGADVPVRDAAGNIAMYAVNTAAEETEPADTGSASGVCTIVAAAEQGANIRSAPSMDGSVVSTLFGSTSRSPVGLTLADANGFRWFLLSDNTWVRADVVTASGACDRLPVASGDAVPEATPAA